MAEWSKALAQGASPQGRGFEPHSCQTLMAHGTIIVPISMKHVVPRGLEPRTLRLLAVRSDQLSYETADIPACAMSDNVVFAWVMQEDRETCVLDNWRKFLVRGRGWLLDKDRNATILDCLFAYRLADLHRRAAQKPIVGHAGVSNQ